MADRIIFQGDKTKSEDKAFLWEFKKCGYDTNMDSVNSLSSVLSIKTKVQQPGNIIYEFYFRIQNDAVSTCFAL
jgi:hypothetical protein